MANTRLEDIYLKLKEKGFDIYYPNTKTGECSAPYTVVKYSGGSKYPNYSSSLDYYDLLLYVPRNKYSELIPYKNQVKQVMKELYPMLVDTGYESPSFLDDKVQAHMISIQYRNNRKL
jgi:hypothetical protein